MEAEEGRERERPGPSAPGPRPPAPCPPLLLQTGCDTGGDLFRPVASRGRRAGARAGGQVGRVLVATITTFVCNCGGRVGPAMPRRVGVL